MYSLMLFPDEIKHIHSQLDLIKYLGLHIMSRNVYCNEQDRWFGGLSEPVYDGISECVSVSYDNRDKITERSFKTNSGLITERLRYVFDQSTLVQEKYLINDWKNQVDALEELVFGRRWKFDITKYNEICEKAGRDGVVIAGEVCSPLKLLHMTFSPVETTYFIADERERAAHIMQAHEEAQLDLIRQMAQSGVPVIMSMDNLDTMFHTPSLVEEFCASYYEKASKICHEYNSLFFIHACGNQKENLPLISSLGVDGMEGVAYPPLGDVALEEAMRITHSGFIISGGISAIETMELVTREQIFQYVRNLFETMKPYANRFIFSASCNTAINTSWDTILNFRDAWNEYA